MKNAVIIHGMPDREEYYDSNEPSASNAHWIPWLQNQLLIKDIPTQTPEMFRAFEPDYSIWRDTFERLEINEETILIGHSCGGGFLVRWFSENKDVQVDKLILVAPWIDVDREETTDFFEFEIDSSLVERTNETHLLYSTDDMEMIIKSVDVLRESIGGMKVHEFSNKEHFRLIDLGSEEFPELLEIVLD